MPVANRSRPGVLVVDDDESIRLFLARALPLYGFEVWSAANGHDALAIHRAHRASIVVVLLDVNMPGLTGPQTLTALHADNPSLPCVFMTGDSAIHKRKALDSLGPFKVFSKPLPLREVADSLHRAALSSARADPA
jgi:DNA-binding NtrC family response regulator